MSVLLAGRGYIMRMWWSLFGVLTLSFVPVGAHAQSGVPAASVAALFDDIAAGGDKAIAEPTSLAWSIDTDHPLADRIHDVNKTIAAEIERVTTAFVSAAAPDKIAATKAVVASIDAETAHDGAGYVFTGSGPSLAYFRQLLFVPAASAGADPVGTVMAISSRFVRSPKTVDYYYEYSDPTNLKQAVQELAGSDTSWTTAARPAMTPGSVYALKKCRDIFILGWYCTTSLYQIRDASAAGVGGAKLLITALHTLPAGADNPTFTDDRAKNVVDGFTALYVVLASGDTVLVYNVGAESVTGSLSVQGKLNDGLKEQYAQLSSRLAAELKIGKLPY